MWRILVDRRGPGAEMEAKKNWRCTELGRPCQFCGSMAELLSMVLAFSHTAKQGNLEPRYISPGSRTPFTFPSSLSLPSTAHITHSLSIPLLDPACSFDS